jgi:hypothetical protein
MGAGTFAAKEALLYLTRIRPEGNANINLEF